MSRTARAVLFYVLLESQEGFKMCPFGVRLVSKNDEKTQKVKLRRDRNFTRENTT